MSEYFTFFRSFPKLDVVSIFNSSDSIYRECYLIVVSICIPLMINNVEHLFMSLFVISSLMKYLFRTFVHFLWSYFSHYWIIESSEYKCFFRNRISKYLLLVCGLSLSSLNSVFWRIGSSFDQIQFVSLFFYKSWFGFLSKKFYLTFSHKDFLFFLFTRSFIILGFILKFIIYCELIVAYGVKCGLKYIVCI